MEDEARLDQIEDDLAEQKKSTAKIKKGIIGRTEWDLGFPFAHKIGVRIIVRTSGEGANE